MGGDNSLSFGKYKNTPLKDIPQSYLEWFVKRKIPEGVWDRKNHLSRLITIELELKRRNRDMEKKTIYQQLIKAQAEFPALTYDSKNPHFKNEYASLGQVIDTIKPTLNKHGLAFTQLVDYEGSTQFVKTVLFNEQGETIESRHVLNPTKQDPQGYGSAITYAKRYSLVAMFGLDADKDDDANEASKPPVTPSVTPIKSGPTGEYEAVLQTIQTFVTDNKLTSAAVSVVTKGKKLDSLSLDELVEAGKQLVEKYGKRAS